MAAFDVESEDTLAAGLRQVHTRAVEWVLQCLSADTKDLAKVDHNIGPPNCKLAPQLPVPQ